MLQLVLQSSEYLNNNVHNESLYHVAAVKNIPSLALTHLFIRSFVHTVICSYGHLFTRSFQEEFTKLHIV